MGQEGREGGVNGSATAGRAAGVMLDVWLQIYTTQLCMILIGRGLHFVEE
jgi:hypothetical protein